MLNIVVSLNKENYESIWNFMKILFDFKHICLVILLCICIISCTEKPVDPDINDGSTVVLNDTILLNESYGSHTRQVFDIHLPAERGSTTSVILMIHGGGWKEGQKEDFNSYVQLIKSKWKTVAVVTMNYRLASNTNNIHHPEIMADINSVVNYLNTNKSKYHISNNIGVVGASAGSHLAMIYAYSYNSNIKCVGNIFGPAILNDWTWYNSFNIVSGVKTGDIISEYVGRTWDTTSYKAASPYWNVTSSTQPTIIFHGNLDPIVPVYHSQWLFGKLKDLGVPTQYHEYIAFHSFDNNQSDDVIEKLVTFFKVYLK